MNNRQRGRSARPRDDLQQKAAARLLLHVDTVIGGRRTREIATTDPSSLRRASRRVAVLTLLGVAVAIVGIATAMWRTIEMEPVGPFAWLRALVLLADTASLLYFSVRVSQGYRWAFTRMQPFSRVFPLVGTAVVLIPGPLPSPAATEQVCLIVVVLALGRALAHPPPRRAFA